MLTPEKAREDYRSAMAALRQLSLTHGLLPEQRQAINDGLDTLTFNFIDQVEMEFNALSSQYSDFISAMSAIIANLQGGITPVAGLNRLTGIVSEGASLINAATGAPAGAKGLSKAAKSAANGNGADRIRVLCVHGVGHQEGDPDFENQWRLAVASGVMRWSMAKPMELRFVKYDDLFAAAPLSTLEVAAAVAKLSVSGLVHTIGDLFHPSRGFGQIRESMRWTAGMVVQWAQDNRLRAAARDRIVKGFSDDFPPDVILAHSLGSLLCYDTFARPENRDLLKDRIFVTFGSQIGNPFVRNTLGGRIRPLESARRWFHLFNPHDDAFTAELRVPSPNFEQVNTSFDIDGILDHDAREYLSHPNTTDIVWRAVTVPNSAARGLITSKVSASDAAVSREAAVARPVRAQKPPRRALLVGINDYPNAADRLEGCVNDVFLMSSLLQECGFEPDNIRVLLNERATASGIVERLQWLLEGSEDEQDRVFFYSGHGAQIPGYGVGETVDRQDECLVPFDFDWSREHAVTDDQFYDLYSQLPYSTRFLTILDCCHSGGMTRDGAARVRGITPPDDIRHRELKWDRDEQMWVARDFQKKQPVIAERKKAPEFFGDNGAKHRIGRAAPLRADNKTFDKALADFDHRGPFMPIIIQACEESQFSYEYRHGVQSYGAFTYSLGIILREKMRMKKAPKWADLVEAVGKKLATLGYDQNPCLVCPKPYRAAAIPWNQK
jgi:hypothetical protein